MNLARGDEIMNPEIWDYLIAAESLGAVKRENIAMFK